MNTAAINRFLKILSSKGDLQRLRLYQLVQAAERAYYLKDSQTQREIGLVLQKFEAPFHHIGSYYEALHLINSHQYEAGEKQLEQVAQYGPERYKAKAVISLGASYEFQGKIQDALRFRIEAAKMSDPLTTLEAQLGVAIFRSIDGDHKGAIAHLEQFLPITKACGVSTILHDYLNSLALEFSEVGRLKEARGFINIVLASNHLRANWIETGKEIYLKSQPASRSLVYFNEVRDNLLILPTSESTVIESPSTKPAKILNYMEWKEKMVKEPNGEHNGDTQDENVDEMDDRDLLATLMQIAAREGVDEEKLRDVVKYAIKTLGMPKQK